MRPKIAVLIITKNNQDTIGKTLESVKDFDEIVVVDSKSKDKTLEKSRNKSKIKIFRKEFNDIGKQRLYGLKQIKADWVLILDSDEVVSKELKKEIVKLLNGYIVKEKAFEIPYQNFFLGKPVNYGGENYKMVRLFRRDALEIKPSIVHNKLIVKHGKVARLKGKILHYSYRSLGQTYKKFTDYALKMAKIKAKNGEKSSLKKIFLYPVHMFWARFVKDKGYKDGMFRIPLDIGFAYMEFLTYFLLMLKTR
ncbi:MAG: Glycosyl transferase family 2 [Candidatus Roizmanbacteria bacterium GW2011_GWC2_37_13]|uniref:Glycosyl transferase family 2 n=1 Tax=Candidatus Roizmanbacteria bacterium GW2011_GWC2_37_13 TaxID=1618486 RepID=A0A0G0JA84_9BACT|nr:MAG: Glycosyl transferase family 2 [Candidatus Roizmanbacteria bacterium GW2011_GWC1_37_12]KKQ25091.1 MAG: Glycosyl transferase family 2 [Candidatus Roizmanbacteria bacterium GW2011_GWC2_37_13]